MDRSRLTFLLLSLAVMLPIVTGALMARGDDEGDDSLFKYLSVFQDVLRLVQQAYVEEISVDDLMAGALDGASDALDPFSTYVPAGKVDGYRAALEVGSAHSGMTIAKDKGIVYLISVANGSPATDAELQPGDILTSMDGEPTRQMPLWRVQQALAGSPGTVVELELLRDGASEEVELTLGTFERSLVEVAVHEEVPVLRFDTIGPATAAAVETALTELGETPATGLIIDLRETVSLDIESGYEVGKLFAAGELGSLATVDGVVDSFVTEGSPAWSGDLVVLLGRGSIGGAEVLAKILRDSAGAKLVGEHSFGYAGRLSLMPLSSGAHLRLTDAFYAGPDGEPISEGLEPDVEVSVRTRSFAEKDIEIDQLTLQRALEVLQNGDELSEAV